MKAEDRIVVQELQRKNRDVFRSLYLEYRHPLLCYAEKWVFDIQVCEDIIDGLFIYLWENASALNISSSLNAYLYRAVRNRCITHLKKLKITMAPDTLLQDLPCESPLPYENESSEEKHELVQQALSKLPIQMQKIIIMKYMEGKKQKEIARILGVSESTVKTQLARGRSKLARLLNQLYRFVIFYLLMT